MANLNLSVFENYEVEKQFQIDRAFWLYCHRQTQYKYFDKEFPYKEYQKLYRKYYVSKDLIYNGGFISDAELEKVFANTKPGQAVKMPTNPNEYQRVLDTQNIAKDTKVAGVKFDEGKLRYDLIPPEASEAEAEVYTIGARKYGDNNYLNGMKWSRVIAALQRHLKAWEKGEIHDPVDKQYHLASIMWCAKTLFMYQKYNLGTDDRLSTVLKGLKND